MSLDEWMDLVDTMHEAKTNYRVVNAAKNFRLVKEENERVHSRKSA